jgi:hypothetical protein
LSEILAKILAILAKIWGRNLANLAGIF